MVMSRVYRLPGQECGRMWWWSVQIVAGSALRRFCAVLAACCLGTVAVAGPEPDTGIKVTPLAYEAVAEGDIASVRESLVSALEGRNYSIVNVLNVQEALNNRNIVVEPIQLVEFINLTRAYEVTRSDERFELFAPLRAALFEAHGRVKLLILRPAFIGETLGKAQLSEAARKVLEAFDEELREVAESVQSGGF